MMTDNRPASFDARLMGYYPHLKRLAFKLTNNKSEQEDLFNETFVYILERWESFRPDGGFYNWITFMMRHVAQDKRRRDTRRARIAPMRSDDRAMSSIAVQPNQFATVELAEALRRMPEGRDGAIVMRRAMGDTLEEIGADYGVGRERARQLEERGRATLSKRLRRIAA